MSIADGAAHHSVSHVGLDEAKEVAEEKWRVGKRYSYLPQFPAIYSGSLGRVKARGSMNEREPRTADVPMFVPNFSGRASGTNPFILFHVCSWIYTKTTNRSCKHSLLPKLRQ